MLDLVKIEEQKGCCREIYEDKNTHKLYCRHLKDRHSKGVYVNHWSTFKGESEMQLRSKN